MPRGIMPSGGADSPKPPNIRSRGGGDRREEVDTLAQAIIKRGIGHTRALTFNEQFRLVREDKAGGLLSACWAALRYYFFQGEKELQLTGKDAEKYLVNLKKFKKDFLTDSPEVQFLTSTIITYKNIPSPQALQQEWTSLSTKDEEISIFKMGKLFQEVSKTLEEYNDIYSGIRGKNEKEEILQLIALKKSIEETFGTIKCPRDAMEHYAQQNPLDFLNIYSHLEDPNRESRLWKDIWNNQVQLVATKAESIGKFWKPWGEGLAAKKNQLAILEEGIMQFEKEVDQSIMQMKADPEAALAKHNKVVIEEQENQRKLTQEVASLRGGNFLFTGLKIATKETELALSRKKVSDSTQECNRVEELAGDLETYHSIRENKETAEIRLSVMKEQLQKFSDHSQPLSKEDRESGIKQFKKNISESEKKIKESTLELQALQKKIAQQKSTERDARLLTLQTQIAKKDEEAKPIRDRLPAVEAFIQSLYENEQHKMVMSQYIQMYVCNAAVKRMREDRELSLGAALTLIFVEDDHTHLKDDLKAELIRMGVDVTRYPWEQEYEKAHTMLQRLSR